MEESIVLGAIIISIILGVVLYFIPTILACVKGRVNKGAIFALNFFLGWSLVGWVVALVWAIKEPDNL